ncbi:PH domain-containing protein [Blastococcus sp. TML/M2B]|uniref:PH domain-containing protein n=1 Tax=unclassified Blastococcus TaxID=2619396 RepID=UPI00190ADE04|nr:MULTISPECIES: PH domain-containing protein [unclassified Blastococcus]MBN1091147.1 PH domain-containing protein [Blastococcus sp. TML/M2B]MBN1095300.1 PH domain-containing protein [Blastococcus sp. TML/C7B]
MTDPAPAPPAPAATARRTSPRVVLVHTLTFRQARRLLPYAIPALAAIGLGGGRWTVAGLVVGVTLVSLVTAALSWWRFSYLVGPGAVVVTRGLVQRSVRAVPTDRIRGVEVEAPPVHRLLGLVRVRIDAAAGGTGSSEEELLVDGLPPAEGDRLRTAVLTRRARAAAGPEDDDATAPPEPAEEEFARFDNRWLLYAPLVGGYLAVPLAAVGALSRVVDELPAGTLPDVDGPALDSVGAAAVVALVALLLLAVGAVVGAAVVNWGFRLVRRGDSLVAVRGLLTRRHTELEIDRIRGVAVADGAGMRLARAARVNALVTGLGDAQRRGQLLPLGPRAEAEALARRLVPDPGPLTAHPAAARRRRITRALTGGLLVTAAGAVLTATSGWWPLLVVGVVLTALGVPLGLGRYASLGHATGPSSFAVRVGWLVRERAVLERRAVVGWQVKQSWFQRRAGLASVVACVGAGRGGYIALDMAADEVADFAVAASEPWAEQLLPAPPAR